jgi:triphosphatase
MAAADLQNSREIEIKLRLQREHLKRLRRHPLLSAGFKRSGKAVRQDSVYFDDRNRTLRQHGISLRLRQIEGRRVQTIKALNGSGTIDRGEWETAVSCARPDLSAARGTPLANLLPTLCQPLEPIFETRVARISFPIQCGNSEIVVSLDRGRILTGKAAEAICELELELRNGETKDLFLAAQQVGGKIPIELSYETKSARGYALLDRGRGADLGKAETVSLKRGTSCAEAFRAIAHECLRQMVRNREGAVRGQAEALHQLRIAMRRFHATLAFFSEIVSGPGAEFVRAELRRLRGLSGPARDLDVFAVQVVDPLRQQFAKDRGLAAFCRQAARERASANSTLRKALRSPQFRKLILQTAAWIEAGDWRTGADALTLARQDAPIEYFAARQLSTLRRKFSRNGKLLNDLDEEGRHRLRLRAKKLRYAAEFFFSLSSERKGRKQAKALIAAMQTMQEKLGTLSDLAARRLLAVEIGRKARTQPALRGQNGEALMAIGEWLSQRENAIHARLMKEAAQAFSEFRKTKPFWASWPPQWQESREPIDERMTAALGMAREEPTRHAA